VGIRSPSGNQYLYQIRFVPHPIPMILNRELASNEILRNRIMSDRGIPKNFRQIEGFGVHTFRLVNREGQSYFVKFHWPYQ
jgi:hypothetical protein